MKTPTKSFVPVDGALPRILSDVCNGSRIDDSPESKLTIRAHFCKINSGVYRMKIKCCMGKNKCCMFKNKHTAKGNSHSKKKCEISHLGGGGGQDIIGSFSHFFIFFSYVLNHTNLQRKSFFSMGKVNFFGIIREKPCNFL